MMRRRREGESVAVHEEGGEVVLELLLREGSRAIAQGRANCGAGVSGVSDCEA